MNQENNHSIQIPPDDELDRFRNVMDPEADRAAQAIFDSHDIRGVHKILGHLATNDSSVDIEIDGFTLPQEVKDYFNDTSKFTFNAEEKRILDNASKIFAQHGPVITFNLAVRSLCKQYAAAKATNVLRMTTLLEKHTDRRVTETFQFVLDVMQLGWYKPGKRGIRSIQVLRLIHALIRFRIFHGMTDTAQGKWNPAWGQPINQEDMIFANQTFSVEVIDGLQEIGVHLNDEEAETYYQAWTLIGAALGVDESLHMPDLTAARALQNKIYDRQFAPNENGPPLAEALITWLIQVIPIEVSRESIITFFKFFNGEENYWIFEKILNVEMDPGPHNFHKHVHQELAALEDHELEHEHIAGMSAESLAQGDYTLEAKQVILNSLSLKLLKGLFKHKRGSKTTDFQIDDAFADRWGLEGTQGIPEPDMPPVDGPKKRHPILQILFDIGTFFLNLVVKVRDFFDK